MSARTKATLVRVALLIGAFGFVWFASAAIVHFAFDAFPNYGEALWSGLEHLLDPGAIEGDTGAGERIVGAFQILFGLVFIVGVLIAVLEEVVSGSVARLAEGERKVKAEDHVVVIGWNPLVPELIGELGGTGQSKDAVAVLLPGRMRSERASVSERLDARAENLKVGVLAGEPDQTNLERVALERARVAIVVSGASDPDHPDAADLETINACLAVRAALADAETSPRLLGLLRRGTNTDAVSERFPDEWHFIVADRALAGMAHVALTRPEIAMTMTRPFDPDMPEGGFFVVDPEPGEQRFRDVQPRLAAGLACGVLRPDREPFYAPPPAYSIEPGDRLIVAAATIAQARMRRDPPERGPRPRLEIEPADRRTPRLLVSGSPTAIGALIDEMRGASASAVEVHLLGHSESEIPGGAASPAEIHEVPGNRTDPADLLSALESVRPDAAFVGTDPAADGEASDSRALITAFHLRRLGGPRLPIVVDVLAPIDPTTVGPDPKLSAISRSTLLARWMTLQVTDPDSAAATQALGDLGARFATVRVRAAERPIEFLDLHDALLERRMIPMPITDEGEELGPVSDGEEVIVIRRDSPEPRADQDAS